MDPKRKIGKKSSTNEGEVKLRFLDWDRLRLGGPWGPGQCP